MTSSVDPPQIAALYRHPVKGLTPERVDSASLEAGAHFPGDRLFALENGPSGFNPDAAEHLPKQRFLTLMRHERLARVRTSYDPDRATLTILQGGVIAAAGDVRDAEGRAAIERFFEAFLGDDRRGPVRLLHAPPGFRFMDSRSGFVSILNLASVEAIARLANRPALDPLRFRGNLHVAGWDAWAENDLVGRRIRIGTAELDLLKRIDRCAAVDVDPAVGMRDLRLVQLLEQALHHHDCGIYAEVTRPGTIRPGDRIELL